ncbi:carboxynorspermidine decarboxylase [Helicobacter brantae]|uniref:Carboxynorspermidine/carboxyspermidine decarboxylase n=1 Tax=Helicobacter brantae TaxID=375927 RepID=A0A3D8IVM9_9HELI|nr:carboxynorspermidine decarboxylase [Helicobacter brantae]RDU69329.1 carboxynorspermidine decarboxylase [Helicobacter brantae]
MLEQIPSPCYVLEEQKLLSNLQTLDYVQVQSGAKILVALKGFAFWRSFELLKPYLYGSTASGLYEAKLGYETLGGRESGKEVCVFSPAYKEEEMRELVKIATHIIFNSFSQWQRFKGIIEKANETLIKEGKTPIEVGLRLNPLYSEVSPMIYNPCSPKSRLGIIPSEFEKGVREYGLEGISGLHFHTHCEQDSDVLERTLGHIKAHFESYLSKMKWINLGGGHHITREGYNLPLLISLLKDFRANYRVEVFLEPGEAVGWQCGFLIAEVVDVVQNEGSVAILDVSASAHMPDCLEMPYRPKVTKLSNGVLEEDCGENIAPYTYRLGGNTCLSGDIIGDYSFHTPLKVGDKILFDDMIHYTIVKNTTFNGVPLPSLGVIKQNGDFELLKTFDYSHYKERNG